MPVTVTVYAGQKFGQKLSIGQGAYTSGYAYFIHRRIRVKVNGDAPLWGSPNEAYAQNISGSVARVHCRTYGQFLGTVA